LALFDRDVRVDRGCNPELPEQLDHERHPGPARDHRGINRIVDLERQPWRRVGHRTPPWWGCTQWVKPSKPDAIAANRPYSGLPRNPLEDSTA
jgi:hypothetical protein